MERDVAWAATNDATFQYDAMNDELVATIVNVNGTYNLTYPNLSTQITSFGKTFNVADLDFMQISVYARHVGTTVTFDNFQLDAASLGTFSATYNSVNTWMVSSYAFSSGFTVTGQILLSGTFSGGDEVSKIELTVGRPTLRKRHRRAHRHVRRQQHEQRRLLHVVVQVRPRLHRLHERRQRLHGRRLQRPGHLPALEQLRALQRRRRLHRERRLRGRRLIADPVCGNGTVEGSCGEECDPPNGLTCDASCQSLAVCGNSVVEPGETCDDGNTLAGDCCNAVCQVEVGPCNDGDNCTTGDVCTPGGCAGTPLDCSFLDSACTDGQCDTLNGECASVNINEGGPCDDGNGCSANDVCLSGICSACGNGTTEAGCGETCDPPDLGICDGTCQNVACGNSSLQLGEECDDGNTQSGDGCSSTCQLEDKLCIEGLRPSVSRQAKKVAFASDYDYLGTNVDGNQEVFLFDRRLFGKDLKKLVKKQGLDPATAKAQLLANSPGRYFLQLTDTTAPVVNDYPTTNATGRVVAFVSSGDLSPGTPGNADGNAEIFRLDVKRSTLAQVTDTSGLVTNLNPNLRAFRGALLAFDSDGDLVTGGNPEGNREVFVYSYKDALRGDAAISQMTSTASGNSAVGRNANYWQRLTGVLLDRRPRLELGVQQRDLPDRGHAGIVAADHDDAIRRQRGSVAGDRRPRGIHVQRRSRRHELRRQSRDLRMGRRGKPARLPADRIYAGVLELGSVGRQPRALHRVSVELQPHSRPRKPGPVDLRLGRQKGDVLAVGRARRGRHQERGAAVLQGGEPAHLRGQSRQRRKSRGLLPRREEVPEDARHAALILARDPAIHSAGSRALLTRRERAAVPDRLGDPLIEAAERKRRVRVGALPRVCANGKPTGILTRSDMLRALIQIAKTK